MILSVFSIFGSGWHIASEIFPGTFQSGNFNFDGDVAIIGVGNTFSSDEIFLNGDCQTSWPGGISADIEGVIAGIGLTGGVLSGTATLNINTSYTQRRVTSSCVAGSSIRAIAEDGAVTCEVDTDTDTNTNAGTICSAGEFFSIF